MTNKKTLCSIIHSIIVDFVLPILVQGCTDSGACNYNQDAGIDDGSCIYPQQYYDCNGDCINDMDSDGICDENDNCINIFNPGQLDANNDGIGDDCDGIGLYEQIIQKRLIKVIDVLGREVDIKNKEEN